MSGSGGLVDVGVIQRWQNFQVSGSVGGVRGAWAGSVRRVQAQRAFGCQSISLEAQEAFASEENDPHDESGDYEERCDHSACDCSS